ncbi:glycoside hydrolase family 47 protein [Microdochium trichocladiopsis]|uniref:alpha-1,2-Mannosidase n=1 Tax=Microdochium trichocladiopsis TaxID=1682393 RepID=A0A9P8Y6J4_9PEZI|nr:glycoside hydrolase family 47 protein [Microdochium trichocladiopsis]KAH7029002.1 glycoside hydrolase family 47 protein [Microdochium trichocladiopsis]
MLRPNLFRRHRLQYVTTSFDWSSLPQRHPVANPTTLPRGTPLKIPAVQHDFASDPKPTKERQEILAGRRRAVLKAFVKSWNAYKDKAWMHDELRPVSGWSKDPFGGWAATLVDSLDTLWILGLKKDFYEAVAAVGTIDWEVTKESACNFFETTIRHLGGLLSAYDLSGEKTLLRKAIELGDMLYAAFDTPTRMPPFWLDFEKAKAGLLVAGTHDPSASVASSSLEFTRLAQLTGDDKYYDAIDRVTRLLERTQNITQLPGMWPTFFDLSVGLEEVLEKRTGFTFERMFTLGALADSLYEYLPKMHALLGGQDPVYEQLYRGAMDAVTKNLLFRPMLPGREDILFSGTVWIESEGPRLDAEGQHLTCFVGGMFGLGGKLFGIKEHVTLGERLARGCAWAYNEFPTGVMPEIFNMVACPGLEACAWDEARFKGFRQDDEDEDAKEDSRDDSLFSDKKKKKLPKPAPLPQGFLSARDTRYLLRPEAIESVFLMYRITGKAYYQDVAWRMFESVVAATETPLAFSAIRDVRVLDGGLAGGSRAAFVTGGSNMADSMESFWLAETLKYFYLVFSDERVVDLDEWVLNTEAHPFRRPRS